MYTLIGLSDGIYLEDSKTRLHWGISREKAWRVGNPHHYSPDDDDTRIEWEDSIFGGLSCKLMVYLPDDTILDRINIRLNPPSKGLEGAAYDYVTVFGRLTNYFGAPKIYSPGVPAPALTWKHDGCEILLGISTRFEDYMNLVISKGAKDTA